MSWLKDAATSPLVVGCSALLLALSGFMALAPETASLCLPLVFANAFIGHFFIWTVLTASFTESSLLKLLWDMGVLACTAHLVDGLLDPPRLALFILVVAAGSAVLTSVSIFLGFVATRWEDLFFTPTYGFAGVLCGLFVLAKERVPTEAVLPGGVLPAFRAQHLPFAWLCACAAARLLVSGAEGGVGMVSDLPLAFWGLFVSWAYLRFFQHHPDGSIGDGGGEGFRFITLFPSPTQPYLAPVANFAYGFSLLCGLCKDRELALAAQLLDEGDEATASSMGDVAGALSKLQPQHQQLGAGGARPGGAPGSASKKKLGAVKKDPVAERRKAKAIKVLDARLKRMEQQEKANGEAKGAEANAGALGDLEASISEKELYKI